MRVATAFNRLLALPGAKVTDISFTADGVVVEVALRRRRVACSSCAQVVGAVHDRSLRRRRHLDLAGQRLFLQYALRRIRCPDCGVRVEAVPFAHPRARHTRDFEDLTAFLGQQLAKTPIASLLRVGWDTVGAIVERVVSDQPRRARLCGLVQIGVDEVSFRRGQRYLTCVADHSSGSIVWLRTGRSAATLQVFFDELGERKASIRAVSIEMSAGYENAVRAAVPTPRCAWLAWANRSKLRPFVKLARTIHRHRTGILAAIRLGLSNVRLEGLNSKVRLFSHRSFGFHGAGPLIALVGSAGLIWPHRDGLNWPHPVRRRLDRPGSMRARDGGRRRSGNQSGAVRTDPTRPRSGEPLDPRTSRAPRRASPHGPPGARLAAPV